MNTALWAHQIRAVAFAKGKDAVMFAAGMGTGKSRIAIECIVQRGCRRVLIVCPKSVVAVWPDQFAQHCPIPFMVCAPTDGSVAARTAHARRAVELASARQDPIAVIVNYDAVYRSGMGQWIMETRWDAVVLDESHRIKAPGGKASLFCSRLGDRVPFRLCLTGTPMPHSPLDCYAQYRFLDKRIFGTSYTLFRARYAITRPVGANPRAQMVIGYQNQDELKRKFHSLAFHVRTEDVVDLPPELDVVRPVQLGAHARAVYEQLKKEFVADFGAGVITAGNALTRLLRLQQITSGYVRQDDSIEDGTPGALVQIDDEKQTTLLDVLEDLNDEEPVVVFCRFRHDLDAVRTVAHTLGRAVLELSGDTNELAAWQSGAAPILAVQIQSGSVGIDLTRARYAVYYSLGFSLGDYLQSRRRISRPGQTRSTINIHLIATKTVDEQVYRALQAREEVINVILSRGIT